MNSGPNVFTQRPTGYDELSGITPLTVLRLLPVTLMLKRLVATFSIS